MRGNTLGALVQMLRRELGVAESPALGRNVRNLHVQALSSAQQRLYQAHDWQFKKVYRDVGGQAGQRYYAPPPDLDLENIRNVQVRWTTLWEPCTRGISTCEYNSVNSDKDERQDPVRRWEMYNDPTDNGDMIEVWPIPVVTGASVLRFYGVKKLLPLVMDADKCEVDDLAIVLEASADLASQKDRSQRQSRADRHVFALARNLSNSDTFVSGGGHDPNDERFRPPQIVISQ